MWKNKDNAPQDDVEYPTTGRETRRTDDGGVNLPYRKEESGESVPQNFPDRREENCRLSSLSIGEQIVKTDGTNKDTCYWSVQRHTKEITTK